MSSWEPWEVGGLFRVKYAELQVLGMPVDGLTG